MPADLLTWGMKLQSEYSLRAERVAFALGAVMVVLVVVHVLAMQANFNPALGLKERFGFHYCQLPSSIPAG